MSGQPRLFRQMIGLAWPAMVQEALQTVVQYADAAMVGQLGAAASAAVGLTTPVGWLINAPLFAMGTGFLSCIARFLGADRQEDAKRASAQSLWAVLALGLAVGGITLAVGGVLPVWLNAAEGIRDDAAAYFRIVCLPMLFRAAIAVFGANLRAAGDTKTPMRIGLAMNALNIALNALLIFPSRGMKLFGLDLWVFGAGWGVRGAAVASAAAYVLGGLLMTRAWLRNPTISPEGVGLKLYPPVLKACAAVALPVVLTRVGMGLGYVVFMAQVSSLGTMRLAAHTLAITAEEAAYLPGFGMQAAASALAGYAVGAGDALRLRRLGRLLIGTAAGLMACTGALLFLFAEPVMRFFSADAEVVRLGARVLRIIALTEPLYAVGIILEGIFHGAGDTRAPFFISMGTMWGVRILLTWITVHLLRGGLTEVWLCMALDNMVRVACLALRYRGGRWRHQLTAL